MKRISIVLFVVIFLSFSLLPLPKEQTPPDRDLDNLRQKIDAYVCGFYPANEPGAAVLATKRGKVILRKGFGLANMELGIPIEPGMIFKIGSVSKQFTAAAIMMLVEEGKMSLSDDITKFLPGYPTLGNHITVEHLLNHTSGIKSYTQMPDWRVLERQDYTVTELIDLFKDKPMNFKPGEKWHYNNSGYFLLGAVIEQVSGKSYREFLQERIFTPLGMKGSDYGSSRRIIPRRVPGYTQTADGFLNASFVSMSTPFSAGL